MFGIYWQKYLPWKWLHMNKKVEGNETEILRLTRGFGLYGSIDFVKSVLRVNIKLIEKKSVTNLA